MTAFAAGFVHRLHFGHGQAARIIGVGRREAFRHAFGAIAATAVHPLAALHAALGHALCRLGAARLMGILHFGLGDFAVIVRVDAGEVLGHLGLAVGGVQHAIGIAVHAGEALGRFGLHFGEGDDSVAIGIGAFALLGKSNAAGEGERGGGKGKDGLAHCKSP